MALMTIKSFIKGINQAIDKQLISEDESCDAQNCSIDDGSLSRSKGTALYASHSSSIKTLMAYNTSSTSTLLAASGSNVYRYTGSSFSSIASGFTSDDFDYVNYQIGTTGVVIFANGKENIKVWDGSSIRDLKHDGTNSTASSTNVAPKGKFLLLHKERLYVSGESANPDRLYFSASFAPDDFTAPVDEVYANTRGGFIDIPTWDKGNIVALASLFDDVIIFKNRQVFRLFGTYPGNYSITQVFSSIKGEIVDKTIASVDNAAYWCTEESIFAFNGTNVLDIGVKVKETLENLNKDYINNAVAIIHKSKYILSVPEGTSTTNNLIIEYDLNTQSYMIKRGINANSFIVFADKLLYASNDNKVYEYNSGDTFNGSSISTYWQSGDITNDRQDRRKIYSHIYFNASGNGTIRIYLKSDRSSSIYKDITLSSTLKPYKIKLKNKGYLFSFRIENVNGSDFTIKQPQFQFNVME